MSAPTGDSPLTSPEAIVAAARQAVQEAAATNDSQQAQAGAWLDGGLPAGEAHAPGAGNAPRQ